MSEEGIHFLTYFLINMPADPPQLSKILFG